MSSIPSIISSSTSSHNQMSNDSYLCVEGGDIKVGRSANLKNQPKHKKKVHDNMVDKRKETVPTITTVAAKETNEVADHYQQNVWNHSVTNGNYQPWRSNVSLLSSDTSSATRQEQLYYSWFGTNMLMHYQLEICLSICLLCYTISSLCTLIHVVDNYTGDDNEVLESSSKKSSYVFLMSTLYAIITFCVTIRHAVFRYLALSDNSTSRSPTLFGILSNIYQSSIINGGGQLFSRPISYQEIATNLSLSQSILLQNRHQRHIMALSSQLSLSGNQQQQQQQQQQQRKQYQTMKTDEQPQVNIIVPTQLTVADTFRLGMLSSTSSLSTTTQHNYISISSFIAPFVPFPIKYILQWIRVNIWHAFVVRWFNVERYVQFCQQHPIRNKQTPVKNEIKKGKNARSQVSNNTNTIHNHSNNKSKGGGGGYTKGGRDNSQTNHRQHQHTKSNHNRHNNNNHNAGNYISITSMISTLQTYISPKYLLAVCELIWLQIQQALCLIQNILLRICYSYLLSWNFVIWCIVLIYIQTRLQHMWYRLPDSIHYMFFVPEDTSEASIPDVYMSVPGTSTSTSPSSLLSYNQQRYVAFDNDYSIDISHYHPGKITWIQRNEKPSESFSSSTSQPSSLSSSSTSTMSTASSSSYEILLDGSWIRNQPSTDQVFFVMICFTSIISAIIFLRCVLPIPSLIGSSTAAIDTQQSTQYKVEFFTWSIRNHPLFRWLLQLVSFVSSIVMGSTRSSNGAAVSREDQTLSSTGKKRTGSNSVVGSKDVANASMRPTGHKDLSSYYFLHPSTSSSVAKSSFHINDFVQPTLRTNTGNKQYISVSNSTRGSVKATTTANGATTVNSSESSATLESVIPWSERKRPLKLEHQGHVIAQVMLLRYVENIFLGAILPRTNYICRYIGQCAEEFELWDIPKLMNPSTSCKSLSDTSCGPMRSSGVLLADSFSFVSAILGIATVSFVLLSTQEIVLNRTYLSSLGRLIVEWEELDSVQFSSMAPSQLEIEIRKQRNAKTWDVTKVYQEGDYVLYPVEEPTVWIVTRFARNLLSKLITANNNDNGTERNDGRILYRAKVNNPNGHPYVREFRSIMKLLGTNEVGHISKSKTIHFLAKIQMIFTIVYALSIVLRLVCMYVLLYWNEKSIIHTNNSSFIYYQLGLLLTCFANIGALYSTLATLKNVTAKRFFDINGCPSIYQLNKELCS